MENLLANNIIYVSTVGRGKRKEEASRVYKIDTSSGKILTSVRLPLSMTDLENPRGGCRGGRGLAFHKNKLYAAIFDGVCELNPDDLFIKKCYWFKEIKDIHQIYSMPDSLVVINSWNNQWGMVTKGEWKLKQDLSNLHIGEPINPAFISLGCTDTLHLNSICVSEDTIFPYGLLSKAGAIVNLNNNTILMDNKDLLRESHDIWPINNFEVAVNLSPHGKTVTIDTRTWELSRVLYEAGEGEGSEIARYGWMRGMSYIPHTDTLLLGSSPAQVVVLSNINTEDRPTSKIIPIADQIVESVFDVIPHPTL